MTEPAAVPQHLDLGPGRALLPLQLNRREQIGYIETHPHAQTGRPCDGVLYFESPAARRFRRELGPFWRIVQADPLTLEPALDCPRCGNYGWITAGKWVPG